MHGRVHATRYKHVCNPTRSKLVTQERLTSRQLPDSAHKSEAIGSDIQQDHCRLAAIVSERNKAGVNHAPTHTKAEAEAKPVQRHAAGEAKQLRRPRRREEVWERNILSSDS